MSIHQPSSSTFRLFDKLLLLSAGRTHYFGSVSGVAPLFESLGYPMPIHMNPAEFVLDLMNIDFAIDQERAKERLEYIQMHWNTARQAKSARKKIVAANRGLNVGDIDNGGASRASLFGIILVLLHRSWIKSYRDIVTYGVRIVMYTGLAIMMGTVWLRLGSDQSNIQP